MFVDVLLLVYVVPADDLHAAHSIFIVVTIEVVDGCCRLPATYTIQSSAVSVSISQNCSVANRRLSLLHLCQPCHALQKGSKSPGLGVFKAKHSQARPSTAKHDKSSHFQAVTVHAVTICNSIVTMMEKGRERLLSQSQTKRSCKSEDCNDRG